MNTIQRYFYRHQQKLKSRKTIDLLFKQGRSFSLFPFRVFWLQMPSAEILQAGIGVPARHFKKAVQRNRIKRLMREAWRLQKNSLEQTLAMQEKQVSVFILYTGNELPEYEQVKEKMLQVINRLQKSLHESN